MATINLSELKTQPTLDQCSCLGQRFVTQGGFRVFSASDLMDFGFRSAPGGPLKTLRLAWLGLRLWFILSQACQAIGAACLPVVVADGAGLAGTTAMMTYDGDLRTYFLSSRTDWQYLQIDLNCTGSVFGIRRYMTVDGTSTNGARILQGEEAAYSLDGVTWTEFTGTNSTGWEGYVNYGARLQAWHSVNYGWSAWLMLKAPATARYVRFLWDGNNDALNEVQLNFTTAPPPPDGCSVNVTSDRSGLSGTTPELAFDGSTGSFFRSSYNDWQYLQIDFNCAGAFSRLRRYMTQNGVNTNGMRSFQGEGALYSLDGATWSELTASNATGWEHYVNYGARLQAWHSVNYGWSEWLTLETPVRARFIRFLWDGNNDALNEVQLDFNGPTPVVTAPKLLPAPKLNGQCDDQAYTAAATIQMQDPFGFIAVPVRLFHSSRDLYLCLSGLPVSTEQGTSDHLSILIDSDNSGGSLAGLGDYRFSISRSGDQRIEQGNGGGKFLPISIPASDLQAVVQSAGNNWNLEVRLSLEWLAGYARTDGFSLVLESTNGRPLARWPTNAAPKSPDTWGKLILAPLYPAGLNAGSIFFDGFGSFLVVPYSPALNPAQITLEAWVKVLEDGTSQGTLVGNGRAQSYWLGLGSGLEFSVSSEALAERGPTPLGPGWHHVAATADTNGVHTIYLDGRADVTAGLRRSQETEVDDSPVLLGPSDRMLRIGSDRNPARAQDQLHGLLHELRVWNYVRSSEQIRSTAFTPLTGHEPGLVGLWPFTQGLQDLAGGHHAGLIGAGSLAHETPNLTAFAAPGSLQSYFVPPPTPTPAWNALLPSVVATVTLDGTCYESEFGKAARIVLEPDRTVQMSSMITTQGLYVCTGVLFGGPGTNDGVTILIDRGGSGGTAPGPQQVRLRLSPDGTLISGTGNGHDFSGAPPAGIAAVRTGADVFALAEDIYHLNTPWWSTEILLPLSTLLPFQPGKNLRLAVRYEGTILPVLRPDLYLTNPVVVSASWPSNFDELRPDTWGPVATVPLPGAPGSPGPLLEQASDDDRTPVSTTRAEPLQRFSMSGPSANDFHCHCPDTDAGDVILGLFGIDTSCGLGLKVPVVGEAVSLAGLVLASNKKWPMVNESQQPIIQAAGIVNMVNVSDEDANPIHTSHDVDMQITLEPGYQWLSLITLNLPFSDLPQSQQDLIRWLAENDPVNGSSARDIIAHGFNVTVSGTNQLVLETESIGLPPNINFPDLNARPKVGDHVTATGRWIFDCGHDPKTELHPIVFFEVDRLEKRPLWPSGPLDEVRTVRVWMNSDPQPFQYRFDGPFVFRLDLPLGHPTDWLPFIRVVQAEWAPLVTWRRLSTGQLEITVSPPPGQSTGRFFCEFVLGYLRRGSYPFDPAFYGPFTIAFNSVDPLRDLIPTDLLPWNIAANVNGNWRQLLWNASVFGQSISLGQVPPVMMAETNLDLQTTAFLQSGLLDGGGIGLESLATVPIPGFLSWGLADLANLPQPLHLTAGISPPQYRLNYTVSRGGTLPFSLLDSNLWAPTLFAEPNDANSPAYLGVIPVPGAGASAFQTNYFGSITDPGQRFSLPDGSELEFFGSGADVDFYHFTTSDFCDLQVSLQELDPILPKLVLLTNTETVSIGCEYAPDALISLDANNHPQTKTRVETFGYHGGHATVLNPNSPASPRPYQLIIRTSHREVRPDWGELLDQQGGRPIDLAKVAPVSCSPQCLPPLPSTRTTNAPWAWQHLPGDVDYYRITFPGVDPRPPGAWDCSQESVGRLTVTACNMDLRLYDPSNPSIDITTHNGIVILDDLLSKYPTGGVVMVAVTNPVANRRGIYLLSAEWQNSQFYTFQECEELRQDVALFFNLNTPRWLKLQSFGGPIDLPPEGFPDSGIVIPVFPPPDGNICLSIATGDNVGVRARLYDGNGVLLAESSSLSAFSQKQLGSVNGLTPRQFLEWNRAGRPTTQAAAAAKSAADATSTYFLEILPLDPLPPGSKVQTPISISSISMSVLAPPPTLHSPRVLEGGMVAFDLSGQPGERYRVEVSTDLQNWVEFRSLESAASLTTIEDELAPLYPQRFYRAAGEP